MTAADMLLSLANALRSFNNTLPDNPGTISFYSYKEDSDFGRKVLDIAPKERDILKTQIDIELTPKQFSSISAIMLPELERLKDWYERHKNEICGDIRTTIIKRELGEERKRIYNDFASKLKDACIREKLFSELNRACYGIDKSVRSLDDIKNQSKRESIRPYFERMIKFTSYPDYNLQEVQEDCNRSALDRETVIAQREERYHSADVDAQKRITQAAYNIYYDVAANMEPVADFLKEKIEGLNKGKTPETASSRQRGRPGTPKDIDSIEKCFKSSDIYAIFIDTIKKYKEQGKKFTGANCSNAYVFLKSCNLLNEDLNAKNIFGDLLYKQYPYLYECKNSRSIICNIAFEKDPFISMLKKRLNIE